MTAKNKRGKGSDPKKAKTLGLRWWHAPIIIVIGLLVYAPSLRNGFTNWDDQEYIKANRDLSDASLHKHFVEKPEVMGNYHPLTMLSLAWSHAMAKDPRTGRLDASVFHLTDLVFHILNGLLIYLLIFHLRGDGLIALGTSLLFVAHPMHVESVAWVSERKDVLYVFFLLIALLCYTFHLRSARPWWLLSTLVLFVMALLSKAMAVSLVPVLFLIDFHQGRKWTWRVLAEKLPFIALALWAGLRAIAAQDAFGSIQDAGTYPLWQRALFGCYGLSFYVLKFFWPSGLSAFHAYPTPGLPLPWPYWAAPLFVVVCAFLAWRSRKDRDVLFGVGFFFFTVVHVLQLLAVGGAVVAERFSYLPYVGLGFAVCVLLERTAEEHPQWRRWTIVAMALFVIGLSVTARARSLVWKDGIALWSDAYATDDGSPKILNNYGVALNIAKRHAEALGMLDRALQRKSDYAEAFYNRGLAKYYLGRNPEAIEDYTRAIELAPELAVAWFNRAGTYFTVGRPDLALPDALKAQELGYAVDPEFIEVLRQQAQAR